MGLELRDMLGKKLTESDVEKSLKDVSVEDVGKMVYDLGKMIQEHKSEINDGNKTRDESLAEADKRLGDLYEAVEKLRKDRPAPTVVTERQGEFATRRGGLFDVTKSDEPTLTLQEVLSLSPQANILRGSDAERVKDIHDSFDATVFRQWIEFAKLKDWRTAQDRVLKLPDFKRLERSVETANYAKTLIHPASGGIAEPLTWTLLSASVLDLVRLQLRVANQFRQVQLVHHKQDIPANRGDGIGVKGGVGATDPPPTGNITSPIPGAAMFTSVSFGLVSFDCEDVLGFLWWSDRAVTDSVISLVPYMREMVAFAVSRAVDRACMSGDTQATHMDDWNTDFATNDARKLWNGLRRMSANYMTDNANAAYDQTDFRLQRKRLGIYGQNPDQLRCWMPVEVLYDLYDEDSVLTVDKFGPQAVVRTGVLLKMDGVDLIPSEWVPTTLSGVTGFGDNPAGAGTEGAVVMANADRFILGQLGTLQVEQTRFAPMMTTILQAAARYDFQPIEAVDGNGIFASGGTAPVDVLYDVPV